jgi:hypothetical protein
MQAGIIERCRRASEWDSRLRGNDEAAIYRCGQLYAERNRVSHTGALMMDWSRRHTAVVVMLLAALPAFAARPLVADDAIILAPHQCQVEAWTQRYSGDPQYWLAPHCNVGGDWELIAGTGAVGGLAGGVLQAKTVFRSLTANGWGVGVVVADRFLARSRPTLSISVPFSVSLFADTLRIHANGGWMRQPGQRSGPLWNVASEWLVNRSLGLTLEAYGNGLAYAQAGLRYAPGGRQRIVLDAAIGDRLSLRGKERYIAVGLTVNSVNLR